MTLPELYGRMVGTFTSKDIFYNWEGANNWLFKQIYSIRGATYDMVMQQISDSARYTLFPYYIIALVIYIVLAYLMMKLRDKGGSRQFLSIWLGVFTVMLIGFAINGGLMSVLKSHFAFPRPYAVLDGVSSLDKHIASSADSDRSFPSGHVSFFTLLVISLWPALSGRVRLFGLFLIAAVAWSRISLGAHFPADTLYAFLITTLLVVILREIIYGIYHRVFKINC